jgi:tetratricopeptide (TPR) repeat protein
MMAQWHWQSGEAAKAMNKLPEVEKHYRDAFAIEPTAVRIHATLGLLLMTQGRLSEAIEPLESLHKPQPDNAQSSLFWGQSYGWLGSKD